MSEHAGFALSCFVIIAQLELAKICRLLPVPISKHIETLPPFGANNTRGQGKSSYDY